MLVGEISCHSFKVGRMMETVTDFVWEKHFVVSP